MRQRGLIILTGMLAWLAAVVVCWRVNDYRLTTVLMPLWRPMFALAGQGPNLGTSESPAYEATPVHAMFGLAGIGVSALVYIGLAGLGWCGVSDAYLGSPRLARSSSSRCAA